ncbi:hypothetical protein KO561_18265 [Radiobacillus kanasensis]|uniref:hypothetical protein n=1 Tax=Radiobacillus kanasensis TaxID=2844358 RepID=UPI001E3B8DCD|nr:hypothetical protein [Radiobacillus kanasensis]UFT99101.1 hypothetical protein KO561_18265 [Radiobacillus kanasensis]
MKLSSTSIGKVLKVFLWAMIILSVIGLISTYLFVYEQDFFLEHMLVIDRFTVVLQLGVNLISIVLYLIWIYKVHNDLNKLDFQYPITSGGALARIMIPFYNFWGLWNIYSVMSKQLKKRTLTNELGKQLGVYLPFYFILLVGSRFLNVLLNSEEFAVGTGGESVWVWSYGVDLSLTIAYLFMFTCITEALNVIIGHNEKSEEKGIA